jgi:hypothetical protein
MVQSLEDQMRDCLQCAADCAKRAKEVMNPRERDEWLLLRSRYRALSEGIKSQIRPHHITWAELRAGSSRASEG